MNTCMGTINGTSVDRFIVDDADILELTCTKTWSEDMNMHLVNTCKQWRKYRLSYVLQVCHKETHYSVQWFVHMMRSMRMNTCMGTINGTSVDRFIVAMQIYGYLHALKPGVNT